MTDRARLQIDTRKWARPKLLPIKYGDRVEVGAGEQDRLQNWLKL